MARRTTLRRRYGRSGVDPAGEYAAHQRRMRVFVTAVSGGVREYVPNSAIPGGVVGGHGIWRYWTRPVGGGKAREDWARTDDIMRVRYES